MFRKKYTKNGILRSELASSFVLLFNTLIWYRLIKALIEEVTISTLLKEAVIFYYVGIVLSSIIGAIIAKFVLRLTILYIWMTLGAFLSVLPLVAMYIKLQCISLIINFLLGFSVGVGLPSSLAYHADHTAIEERGLTSGIIFLATNIGIIPLFLLLTIIPEIVMKTAVLALWRVCGILLFKITNPRDTYKAKQEAFINILRSRTVIYYLIPWILFNIIDRLVGEFSRDITEAIFGGFSSIVGGYLADKIGRKRIVVYGFVMLGLAYGTIGVAPAWFLSHYIYSILDGFAAGMLWVAYILVLWGDLSKPGNREGFYMIGNVPFLATRFIPLIFYPYLANLPRNALFSIASFFLFLAVLPLMYAPETLPEKVIRRRELKEYVEKAKELREKYMKEN